MADLLKADNIHDVDGYMMKLLSPQEEFMKMLQGLPAEANELDDHIGHMKAHEQQRDQLMQLTNTSQAGTPQETQARSALILLVAHANDHARIMHAMDSKNPGAKQPGEPQAENSFRQDMAPTNAGETQAEMNGGPVGGDQVQTPAGVGVA